MPYIQVLAQIVGLSKIHLQRFEKRDIEDWHRVLKSGCAVEDLRHESAERLKRAIAIRLVIAWRIMLMTLLGRECPGLPAEILFSELEIAVLAAYAKKKPSASHSTRRGRALGRTHRRVS